MSKHTEGPWEYRRDGQTDIVSLSAWLVPPEPGEPGTPITVVDLLGAMGGENTEADAQLIAAAPDLLAACREALAEVSDISPQLIRTLEAAIAKVEEV